MKKIHIVLAGLAAALAVTSCGNNKLSEEQARNNRLDDSLRVALANSDSLFSLLYDVTVGMDQIAQLEQLVSAPINAESASSRDRLRLEMEAIQQGLQQRRRRIAELEAQLQKAGNANNEKLSRQIAQLREQLEKQVNTANSLRRQLEAANIHIDSLGAALDSLGTVNDSISAARARSEKQLADAIDELNTVYYVIGTNDELREHNIIEGGGFLRKTRILPSDFDRSYMQRADRRTLRSIPLDAKKAKVLTNQPKDTYSITTDSRGIKNLEITQPEAFWQTSNIVVIRVN